MTNLLTTEALQRLPADVLPFATKSAYRLTLKHGELATRAGEPPLGMVYLASGAITVNRKHADGSEIVVCFVRKQRWLMGELLADNKLASHNAYALGTAELVVWPRNSFLQAFQQSAALREFTCSNAVNTQAYVLNELEATLSLTLPQKLARRLLQLADQIGKPMENNAVKLAAPISHSLLASSLGVTRQRIHSQLREWSQLGWVESSYRDVVVRKPLALLALIGLPANDAMICSLEIATTLSMLA